MFGWSRIGKHLLALAVLVGVGLPAAAQVSDQSVPVSYTMTPERIAASLAGVIGLIGVVVGALALARSTSDSGTGDARRRGTVALVLGPLALVIGGLVVATADGGLGTGNGLAGGVVAMVVGAIGIALGGLAVARSRRAV